MPERPPDSFARDLALDIRHSLIVQAPAGSGKTDLLTRRILRLLAVVDEPEEILAITFTRAATAEMRSRILADLEAAAGLRSFSSGDPARMALARDALVQSERRGWNLIEQPQRLAIETIDSLSLRIAHDRPLLARLGGRLAPTEQPEPLYALAARRTLRRLGGANPVLHDALAHFLDIRDNRLAGCESLLAHMLKTRDQWQHIFPLSGDMTEDDWDRARLELQAPFSHEVRRVLAEVHALIDAEPVLRDELLELVRYACDNGNQRLSLLAGLSSLSPTMPLEHWRCLADFLLTKEGGWRRDFKVTEGFPPEKTGGPAAKRAKERIVALVARLRQLPLFRDILASIRLLPPPAYTQAQWTTLRHVCTVLRQAIAELRVVFAEHHAVDFSEVTFAALQVLRESPERVLDIAGLVRHLLIDEFQDTSRLHYDLVTELLRAWDLGEHRSVFLVGDPMQSIYMFRQAEVELFAHARDHGIGPEDNRIPCELVQLSVNFRSHAGLTGPLNEIFSAIGAGESLPGSAAVAFAPATASTPAPDSPALHIHPQVIGSAEQRASAAEARDAQREEARHVLRILESHLDRIQQARAAGDEYRVAVLVRNRNHLAEIVPLLREAKIPFRAVEIERLSARQELLDLRSLTRALLHPMDRIAWLAVLRAPWCGLTLPDLHRLAGSDDPACATLSVLDLIDRNAALLSADGRRRLARTVAILRRALDLRWRQSDLPSFSSWIERVWRTLGGPACLDPAGLANAQVFFTLLDSVDPDGFAPLTPEFDAQLDRLFAQPDPAVSERCGIQLMTIHKAKGLGFDVVIVPGLDRATSRDSHPLVCSLQRISPSIPGRQEFLVAPIGLQGEETDPLYQWVLCQRQIRFDEERKRLFYVACTRARSELHLLGTAVASASGVSPRHSSLLATAWPALSRHFQQAFEQRIPAPRPSAQILPFPQPGVLSQLAAEADAGSAPTRLPAGFEPIPPGPALELPGLAASAAPDQPEFRRPQGTRLARAIGSVVHALLQRLGPDLPRLGASQLRSRAVALLRSYALHDESLKSATASVTNMLLACAADPVCQWILASHPDAQSEASWTTASGARLRTLRADRVFRAGSGPLLAGEDTLWVIDYKTSPAPAEDRESFLRSERSLYAPQLLAYAAALRALHGPATPLRVGLYYPAISVLDYWDPAAG